MAMSNWDTIAWDLKGEPCLGVLECPFRVEIYKNWVNVHSKNKILNIIYGEVYYKTSNGTLEVIVKQGKQNGIYLAAIYSNSYKNEIKGLFGIGCYGYEGDRWVGVKKETIEDFERWLRSLDHKSDYFSSDWIPKKLKAFKRYNQGDLIFSKRLGFSLPMTEPHKAEKPIFEKLLEK